MSSLTDFVPIRALWRLRTCVTSLEFYFRGTAMIVMCVRELLLCSTYPTDLDGSLSDERIQFKHFVQNETSPVRLLQALKRHGQKTMFPNVYVTLRLLLTFSMSNCEGGRLLKQVKNELRTTVSQTQLSALSLLAIEHELVSARDFEDIVHQFAHSKSRKKASVRCVCQMKSSISNLNMHFPII